MTAHRRTLDELIVDVQRANPGLSTEEIADRVVKQLDPTVYRTYLVSAISQVVTFRASRARAIKATPVPRESWRAAAPVPPPRTPPRPSVKQTLIRDEFWPAFLEKTVNTPSGPKRLADATVPDLRFIANRQRALATQFDHLADVMEALDLTRVEEIPADVGRKAVES